MEHGAPCMDNNRLVVVSETRTDLELALKLAFRHVSAAWSWWEWTPPQEPTCGAFLGVPDRAKFLVFSIAGNSKFDSFSTLPASRNRFPMAIDVNLAVEFAEKWLEQQDFGEEPDHDGSNGKGFVVFNQPWGHVAGDQYSFVAIGPAWAMRGK